MRKARGIFVNAGDAHRSEVAHYLSLCTGRNIFTGRLFSSMGALRALADVLPDRGDCPACQRVWHGFRLIPPAGGSLVRLQERNCHEDATMIKITSPQHPLSQERLLQCEEALEPAFHQLLWAAINAGWDEVEASTAVAMIADHHILALAENQNLERILARARKNELADGPVIAGDEVKRPRDKP